MPHQPVASLQDLCLANMVDHMDSVWCRPFYHFGSGSTLPHLLYVVGPLDDLPQHLSHRLWQRQKRRCLKKAHVYALVNPFYKQLECRGVPSHLLPLLVELVGVRCQVLTSLDLSCCRLPTDLFLNHLPSICRHLTSLNLSESETSRTDSLVAAVGVYCSKLTDLNLAWTNVSDAGLASLFLPEDEEGRPDERFGQCRDLHRLDLTLTHVSVDGCKRALINLPELVEMQHEKLIQAVYKARLENPEQTFALIGQLQSSAPESFSAAHTMLSPEQSEDELVAAVLACPRAHAFRLFGCGEAEGRDRVARYSSLLPLLSAEADLKGLTLSSYDLMVDFPMLAEVRLATLTHLKLEECFDLLVHDIVRHCPELRRLELDQLLSYRYVPAEQTRERLPPLQHLTHLEIHASDDQGPDQGDLIDLLRSPKLETVRLLQCCSLDDDVFDRLNWPEPSSSPPLTRLRVFHVGHSPNLTLSSMMWFLLGQNPLESVVLSHCRRVTLSDISDYRREIAQKRLRVDVEWS